MIDMLLIVAALTALAQQPMPAATTTPPIAYGNRVDFRDGKCSFWTGDVKFDARGYTRDLKTRFDPVGRLVIYHAVNVPARCVRAARKAAGKAGFTIIDTQVGAIDLSVPR